MSLLLKGHCIPFVMIKYDNLSKSLFRVRDTYFNVLLINVVSDWSNLYEKEQCITVFTLTFGAK